MAVAPEVSRAELHSASRRRPASLGAHQLALHARAMGSRAYQAADTATLPAVLDEAMRALAIDPKCSLALLTLGHAHLAAETMSRSSLTYPVTSRAAP